MLSAAAVTTHHDLVVSIPKAELRSVLGEDVEESSSGAIEGSDSGSGESRKLWEKWRSFLVVCLLILVVSFNAAAYSLVGPFLPIAAAEKGSSPVTTGIIIGAPSLFIVILSPVFGYYLPKLGVKFTLVSGILLLGGAYFLLGFLVYMPPGAVFVVVGIVLRSAEGVGWAMGKTTTLALLPYLYPSRVGLISGLVLGFEGLGYSIAPPIGSLFASEGDYYVPFWMLGGMIIILSPLALLLVKPPESLTAQCLPFSVVIKLLRDFNFSMLLLTIAMCYSAMSFMDVTLSVYLRKIGLNLVQIGISFGVMGGSYVLFAVPFGKFSDIFGTRKFIISGLFMEATSLMIIGVTPYIPLPELWTVVSALAILGCAIAQIDIPVYCELLHKAHSLHPTMEKEKDVLTCTVSGIVGFSMSLGELLGALLGGLLTHLTDFPTAVLMLGETVAAYAILVLGVSLIDLIAEYMSPTQTT